VQCERPKCTQETTSDLLYCSERCFELDHDPCPVQPLARNKAGGFGNGISRMTRQPVILPNL